METRSQAAHHCWSLFLQGKRYAVEDGSATMLADPDTLSTLRTTLLQPRPDPPMRANDARVTSANRGTMLRCISCTCETICKLDRLPELPLGTST